MQSGVAIRGTKPFRLVLLLAALVCAGCNLDFTPPGAPARFEGPPVIVIAAPLPNQTFLAGTTVFVQARVENAGPDLARISVLLDDTLLGEQLNPNETNAAVLPLTIDWPTSNEGEHKISVMAERGDGTSAREDVSIQVISKKKAEEAAAADVSSGESVQPAPQPTDLEQVSESSAPAEEAAEPAVQPAATAPSPTEEPPVVSAERRVAGIVASLSRLREGPGKEYNLLGILDENHEVTIVAVNPARNWYRIQFDDQGDAWIDSDSVEAAGDISGIPVETGPPAPIEDGVNLIVTDVQLELPIVCNQPSIVRAKIWNKGTDETHTLPWVIAEAVLLNEGRTLTENPPQAYLKTLKADEEHTLEIPVTLTTHFVEEQLIRVTVDSGNHVPETDETDNTHNSATFILQKGDCG